MSKINYRMAAIEAGKRLSNQEKEQQKKKNSIIIDLLEFDSKEGVWKVSFHENGNSYTELYPYNYEDVKDTREVLKEFKSKKDKKIVNKIDVGLCSVLNHFDNSHSSDLLNTYLSGNLNCNFSYKLSKLFTSFKYRFFDRVSILKNAYFQKKYKNASIEYPKNGFVLPVLISGTILMGLFGLSDSKVDKEKSISNNSVSIETDNVVEESKTEIERLVDKTIEETTKKEETVKTDEVASIDDKYKLNQVTLSNSVIDASKSANTDNLNCEYYSISLVSVVNENKILAVEEANVLGDITISEMVDGYKEQYGQEIDIFVNFDGYTINNEKYDKIGWTNVKSVKPQMKLCMNSTNNKQYKKVKA